MKESMANRVFQGIVGVLFIGFGLLYLLVNQVSLDLSSWVLGGVVAVGALIRLIVICLPSSKPFAGSNALEIITGMCEALFGILFVLNAISYLEFIYPLLAGLLIIMAIVRILQSARIKKMGQSGWGSYVFMGIILLCSAAGLAVMSYVYRIELHLELIGATALLYGFFLVFSASFKHGIAGTPVDDTPAPEEGGTVQTEEITE